MNIDDLGPLVFSDFNDSDENPRRGLGYHQLYDPNKRIGLTAKLPDVTRVGDTITLYWNNNDVQQYNLDQPTIDQGWLSFSVGTVLVQDPGAEVYYTLFDNQAGDLQTSPTRTVAVSRLSPGDLDPDTSTAINENLVACTVSPDPVNNPAAAVIVTVPAWAYQEVGDELTVMWNNLRVIHPALTTLGPQNVVVPPETLEAGGSSDMLLVNYEVRDIVDNYSLVSPSTYVRVEIDPDALASPRVNEADRVTLILNLEALGDADAHVAIPSYTGNGKAYTVTLDWVGKTPTADISLTLAPVTVDDPGFDHATFTIPNAHLKLIAGGSAVVRYSLSQTGATPDKQSKTTTITLTGLPVQLALAVVKEAGGTTTIDLALIIGDSATVTIAAYSGQSVGDKIVVNWKGTSALGDPVNYSSSTVIVVGGELKEITFNVPRAYADQLAGGALELSYQVVFSATGSTQNSPIAGYTVIGTPLQLAPPAVDEANGALIDPGTVTLAATVRIKPYNGKDFGDIIYLRWEGTTQTGTSLVHVDEYSVGKNESNTDVTFLVDKSHLDPLINGTLAVSYRVLSATTENTQPSSAATYTVGTSILLLMPTVDNALDDVFDPAKYPQGTSVHVDGQAISLKRLDTVTIYWTGATADGTASRDFRAATDNQMLTWPITTALIGFSRDASVDVFYEVLRSAGGQSKSFTRTLSILGDAVPGEITDDFSIHTGDLITVGGSVTTPHMTIRFLSGAGQAGFAPGYILPPEAADYFVGTVLQLGYAASGNQTLELELNVECRIVNCDVHGVETGSTAIRYLDANKLELHAEVLPKASNQHLHYESLGKPIRYIEIVNQNKDWTLWDNFVMQV